MYGHMNVKFLTIRHFRENSYFKIFHFNLSAHYDFG